METVSVITACWKHKTCIANCSTDWLRESLRITQNKESQSFKESYIRSEASCLLLAVLLLWILLRNICPLELCRSASMRVPASYARNSPDKSFISGSRARAVCDKNAERESLGLVRSLARRTFLLSCQKCCTPSQVPHHVHHITNTLFPTVFPLKNGVMLMSYSLDRIPCS